MNVALILFELAHHSQLRGEVWGEEIDALAMRRALLRRADVTRCDILTINTYLALRDARATTSYDLAIHFFDPSISIPGALNVLYFQQFYDIERHDLRRLCREYDRVFTPARAIATEHDDVELLPLAVDCDYYKPLTVADEAYRSDTVFIGNAHIRDTSTYIDYLTPLLHSNLAIYGSRWDLPMYAAWRKRWRGVLPIEKAAHAYAGASVALSIHNQRYLKDLGFATTRPLHSLACGRATVSDTNAELARLLPPDASGLRHTSTAKQFQRAVAELVADPVLCTELGSIGRTYVMQYHSWDVRLGELFNSLP